MDRQSKWGLSHKRSRKPAPVKRQVTKKKPQKWVDAKRKQCLGLNSAPPDLGKKKKVNATKGPVKGENGSDENGYIQKKAGPQHRCMTGGSGR